MWLQHEYSHCVAYSSSVGFLGCSLPFKARFYHGHQRKEAFPEAGKPKLWKLGVLFICRLQKDTQSLPGLMILQDMVLEKQFKPTIRLISGSRRSAVARGQQCLAEVHRAGRLTDGLCGAGWLLAASEGVSRTGSQAWRDQRVPWL